MTPQKKARAEGSEDDKEIQPSTSDQQLADFFGKLASHPIMKKIIEKRKERERIKEQK